jgi:hypothetical protein
MKIHCRAFLRNANPSGSGTQTPYTVEKLLINSNNRHRLLDYPYYNGGFQNQLG